MKASEQIDQISAALAAAQAEMSNPAFDAQNPHFRNRFASLAAVRNAVVPVLEKHGVSVHQDLTNAEGAVRSTTLLTHKSGQWIEFGPLAMPLAKADAQGVGSSATYCRRYQLMAVCGVVGDDDDDAETAVGRQPQTKINPVEEMTKDLTPLERKQAEVTAKQMKELLNVDKFDEEKCLGVADLNDTLKTQGPLYAEAAKHLSSKERAYWKELVRKAMEQEKQEPRTNGYR